MLGPPPTGPWPHERSESPSSRLLPDLIRLFQSLFLSFGFISKYYPTHYFSNGEERRGHIIAFIHPRRHESISFWAFGEGFIPFHVALG